MTSLFSIELSLEQWELIGEGLSALSEKSDEEDELVKILAVVDALREQILDSILHIGRSKPELVS